MTIPPYWELHRSHQSILINTSRCSYTNLHCWDITGLCCKFCQRDSL